MTMTIWWTGITTCWSAPRMRWPKPKACDPNCRVPAGVSIGQILLTARRHACPDTDVSLDICSGQETIQPCRRPFSGLNASCRKVLPARGWSGSSSSPVGFYLLESRPPIASMPGRHSAPCRLDAVPRSKRHQAAGSFAGRCLRTGFAGAGAGALRPTIRSGRRSRRSLPGWRRRVGTADRKTPPARGAQAGEPGLRRGGETL